RGPLDILVSNPPYVARADIAGLQAEVRDFDPRRALDGGPDGLDAYRAIAPHAARLLAPDGILVLELGQGQLGSVTSILATAGLAPVEPRYDLAGIARALVLRALPRGLHIPGTKKSTWIVGQDRLGSVAGIDPRSLSTDSEPRSRTAESRRCGRSERRTPDDPADGSPNRDWIFHRFGADPRATRTCLGGRAGQRRGMLRTRGCCFATRNLTLRRTAPHLPPCLNGRGRGPLRFSCGKASRCLVQHGGGEPSQ